MLGPDFVVDKGYLCKIRDAVEPALVVNTIYVCKMGYVVKYGSCYIGISSLYVFQSNYFFT